MKRSNYVTQHHRKVLGLQLGVAFMISGVMYYMNPLYGQALIAGSAIGMVYSLMLGETAKIADRIAITDPKMSMVILYGGAVLRFVVIGGLLGIGIFKWNEFPLGIIVPFMGILIAPTVLLLGKKRLTD